MSHSFYTFISGILFLFGLSENPMLSVLKQYEAQTDESKLMGDWYQIGNDIRHSYEKLTQENC